ncbi:MAG TPA: hypothetical protein VGN26_04095 [Armatimonadota bacterium]|jgi:hypothetical protein
MKNRAHSFRKRRARSWIAVECRLWKAQRPWSHLLRQVRRLERLEVGL